MSHPKRGGYRPGSGRKPKEGGYNKLLTMRSNGAELEKFAAIGGARWLHEAIANEYAAQVGRAKAEIAYVAELTSEGKYKATVPAREGQRLPAREINAALKDAGRMEQIQRGPGGGYYYWHGGVVFDAEHCWPSVYVASAEQLTLDEWLAVHADNVSKMKGGGYQPRDDGQPKPAPKQR